MGMRGAREGWGGLTVTAVLCGIAGFKSRPMDAFGFFSEEKGISEGGRGG